jgi:hypothetical protein
MMNRGAAVTKSGLKTTNLEVPLQRTGENTTMRIKLGYFTAILGSTAAAVAIAAAPIAAAAQSSIHSETVATQSTARSAPAVAQPSCTSSGTQTACQSPGNVQVFAAPPKVDYLTYDGGAT